MTASVEGPLGQRLARTVLPFDDVKRRPWTPRNVSMPAFTPALLAEDEPVDIDVFRASPRSG